MARGRKGGPTRMDLRRQAEAAEAQEGEEEVEEEEEEAGEEAEGDAGDGDGDDDDGGSKKKKPAKKKAAPKAKKATTTKSRTRVPKEVRQRAVWRIFDNGSKPVETFPFNQKAEAEAFLAKVSEEKKGPFYLNLVKEEIKD